MELSEKSQFQTTENYCTDIEDYDDLPDLERNYLEFLSFNSTEHDGQTVDDIGLKYLPSTSKLSMVTENQTTDNFLKDFDSFYSEMMMKVHGLKTTSALNETNYTETDNMVEDDDNLFSTLKNMPEMQEQLEYIKKLDDELKSVITDYQTAKEERLETQLEMCREITKNNTFPERDTDLFLNLCLFEFSDKKDENIDETGETSATTKKTKPQNRKPKDFIMRNINLAKQGVYANSQLTDEEKVKIEDLLQYEDQDTQERQQRSPFTLPSSESGISKYFSNAYCFSADDKKTIDDIDTELEKFKLDERKSEKNENKENSNDGDITKSIDEIRKLNNVLLEKKLKKLEDRLKEIQQIESKDLETLKIIREKRDNNFDSEDSDDLDDMLPTADLLKFEKELEEINLEESKENNEEMQEPEDYEERDEVDEDEEIQEPEHDEERDEADEDEEIQEPEKDEEREELYEDGDKYREETDEDENVVEQGSTSDFSLL